jgi:general secretion pathway protein I
LKSFLGSPRGFTLLEVTVALAILAVAFTTLSTLQARNLSLTAENRTLTTVTLAARDVIARVRTGMLLPEDAEGELEEDHPGWRWRIRAVETEIKGLWRVEISIFQEEDDPDDGITFTSFLRHQEEEEAS